MGFVRALWASVQGDPVFMRRVNGWLTIFWIAMIPDFPGRRGGSRALMYRVRAVVVGARLRALVCVAGRTRRGYSTDERKQAEAEHPVEQRVVEKIVEETHVDRSG